MLDHMARHAGLQQLTAGDGSVLGGGDLGDEEVGFHRTSQPRGWDNYAFGPWEPCSTASSPRTGRRQRPTSGTSESSGSRRRRRRRPGGSASPWVGGAST